MASFDGCHCLGDRRQNSILYNILKNDNQTEHRAHRRPGVVPPQQACLCGSKKKVALRCPQITCKAASAVLMKTLKFVKNVLCFRELPADDQLLLVRSSWAPLLVLGMAQDRVDFETTELPEPSMLQRILTGGQEKKGNPYDQNDQGVSQADTQAIKAFLSKCWGLDISTKEYAYLKGAVLFNPDLVGLLCLHYIHGLQSEAHQALNEYVKMIHREDPTRFAKLLIALSMLRSINANVVAELFFRPVIGTVNMEELLLEMFYGK
ncbi:nuclear receptor subfamily 0 group B member 1-like [Megalops cyprinoides]|uniref:nuclear receptor subfamily 0 group B member 1-like n=1 Tax=Megalops cyprinoides TaxID=118141 RepID=UPI001864A4D3|nr:nuclear receptor subfamily 0 group B member 1-like [Megalops cyprinoides]